MPQGHLLCFQRKGSSKVELNTRGYGQEPEKPRLPAFSNSPVSPPMVGRSVLAFSPALTASLHW